MTMPGSFPKGYAANLTLTGQYKNPPKTFPAGKWWMMANGRIYTLTVPEPFDASQVLLNSLAVEDFKYEPRTKYKDGKDNPVSFVRVLEYGPCSDRKTLRQLFQGHLMMSNTYKEQAEGGELKQVDDKYRIAGQFFHQKKPGGKLGLAGGWYATIERAEVLNKEG